jgi:hypothetical protein
MKFPDWWDAPEELLAMEGPRGVGGSPPLREAHIGAETGKGLRVYEAAWRVYSRPGGRPERAWAPGFFSFGPRHPPRRILKNVVTHVRIVSGFLQSLHSDYRPFS